MNALNAMKKIGSIINKIYSKLFDTIFDVLFGSFKTTKMMDMYCNIAYKVAEIPLEKASTP